MPTYGDFMDGLLGNGRVRVGPARLQTGQGTVEQLRTFASIAAAACPGTPPAADLELVRQAMDVLYQACQFVVLRDLVPGTVPRLSGSGPGAHWSVDIALRHVPAVARLATARSPDDPLLPWLKDVVHPWPLSAVGMAMDPPPDPTPLLADAALAMEYGDRCILAGDRARMSHPALHALVASAIGGHPELVSVSPSVESTA